MIFDLSICRTFPRNLMCAEQAASNPTQTGSRWLTYLSESDQSQPFLFVTVPKMPKVHLRMPRFIRSRGIFSRRGKNGGPGQLSRPCAEQEWRPEASGT